MKSMCTGWWRFCAVVYVSVICATIGAGLKDEVADPSDPNLFSATPGAVDPVFNAGVGPNGEVRALAVQPDGKILIGGYFSEVAGVKRSRLARLNNDGSLDITFNTEGVAGGSPAVFSPRAAQTAVNAILIEPDGKILVGGDFTLAGNEDHQQIARFNPDGSVDRTFNTKVSGWVQFGLAPVAPKVFALARQRDGKLLVAGQFTNVNGVATTQLARLRSDGSIDPSFDGYTTGPGVSLGSVFDAASQIRVVALQSDGKVVIGGRFAHVSGLDVPSLARLETNGLPDVSFHPILVDSGGASVTAVPSVRALVIQPDGKILLGGMTAACTVYLARLNPEGTPDPDFTPPLIAPDTNTCWNIDYYSSLNAIALQPDGKILVAGRFARVDNRFFNRIVRLNANGTLDESFSPGTGAEGVITPGGDLTHVNTLLLQPDGRVLAGGEFVRMDDLPRTNLARLFTEGTAAPSLPMIRTQPSAQSLVEGQTLTLSVEARGTPPLIYRWQLDGLDLPGATNSIVTLADVRVTHAGSYRVVISNAAGSMSSQDVPVTVASSSLQPGAVNLNFSPPPLGAVSQVAAQRDGKVIVNNKFANGSSGVTRLGASGKLDATFSSRATANNTFVLLVEPDDRIILGGAFTSVASHPRNHLARLNADGDLDLTFDPSLPSDFLVSALARQADGKILAGGVSLARVNTDGASDPSFDSTLRLGRAIQVIAVQPDSIVVGTTYATAGIIEPDALVRFTSQGKRDDSFQPSFGPTSAVFGLIVQPDGKVVVGGRFDSVNGTPRSNLVRLNRDGTVDTEFQTDLSPMDAVLTLALDRENRILLGTVLGLSRLESDGRIDSQFIAKVGFVSSIAELPDGQLGIAGQFGMVNSIPRPGLATLFGTSKGAFKLSNMLRIGATLRLSTPTMPDKTYVLERKDSLGAGSWWPVQSVTGTGLDRVLTDTNTPAASRFYRVRAE